MASPLKRKRTAPASSSSASLSPAPTSTSTPRRPFAPIFEDSLPSPLPISSSSLSDGDALLRAQLELSLAELRTSAGRIESLLRALPSTSRNALTEVSAPPQLASSPNRNLTEEENKVSCTTCRALQDKVQELQSEQAEHEKERQAWKEFKSWWLASLAQREKRHRKKHKSKSAPTTRTSSGTEGTTGTEHEKQGNKLSAVVKKLDASTREVWARAGIIPPDEPRASTEVEAEKAAAEVARGVGAGQRSEARAEQGSMNDSAGQQSEVTLPLHAVLPSKAIPGTTTTAAYAPPAPAQLPTPRRPNSPLIRTTTTRSTTTTGRTAPTTTTTAAEQIGHIDSTPIRNRLQRRTMLAHDCPDCSLFYSHLNANGEALGDRERMACSRHRTTFQRATTPDGYWNIGFPTTQEVEEINASAKAKRVGEGSSRRR